MIIRGKINHLSNQVTEKVEGVLPSWAGKAPN